MLTLMLVGGECVAVEAGSQMHVTLAVDLGEFLMNARWIVSCGEWRTVMLS